MIEPPRRLSHGFRITSRSVKRGCAKDAMCRSCDTDRTSDLSSKASSNPRARLTMQPISVLFTNNALGARGGSETYIRDVALALLQRGHRPVAFSLLLGDVAEELRRATVPVVDDLKRLARRRTSFTVIITSKR